MKPESENDREEVVRFIQITDTHLFADTSDELVGMNCDEGLLDVTDIVLKNERGVTAVICTGDVSQDNSAASYQRLELVLSRLKVPQYWIPGNHDEIDVMRHAIGADNPCFTRSFVAGNWRVIMLNSSVKGQVYGRLEESELSFLAATLAANKQEHVLVCLHHNPVPVAAAWLQHHCLKNAADLFAVLDGNPAVKAVLFGHIHHQLETRRNNVSYLGSPSTCIQFHPSSADFALDVLNPGYRWLELHPNGELRTDIVRVQNKSYDVDFSGIGY